jgi:hypothetical protein
MNMEHNCNIHNNSFKTLWFEVALGASNTQTRTHKLSRNVLGDVEKTQANMARGCENIEVRRCGQPIMDDPRT